MTTADRAHTLEPDEGYYPVSWDDDGHYGSYYVRFGGYGPTWGWDQEDDPEMIPEEATILINGQKRYAREFRKDLYDHRIPEEV